MNQSEYEYQGDTNEDAEAHTYDDAKHITIRVSMAASTCPGAPRP